MALVSVVLIVFYLFTMAMFFLRVTENVQSTLRNYSSENFISPYFDLGVQNETADNYAIDASSVCVVGVNEAGTIAILDVGHGHMSQELLSQVVQTVLSSEYNFGHLMRHNLFYYKTDLGFGYRIAFADSSRYYSYLRDMLYADGIIFLVVLIILYFINRGLAKIFIKPVQRAWTQQQNFIADASHELKTPLTVILANCDILQTHPDETVSSQMKWVESTNEEASHMKEMVNKMLFLAKNEASRSQNFKETVCISELCTKVALQFEPVAFEAGVQLDSDIEENVEIRADPTAVNQIIHILVDNAVKYAGLGGTASIHLKRKQNTVILSARNTGEPIPAEDLPHIFERFYRSDKARTSGTGYGLGLAICKSLVEQQKAAIEVTSTAEKGTEFTVRFLKQKQRKKS